MPEVGDCERDEGEHEHDEGCDVDCGVVIHSEEVDQHVGCDEHSDQESGGLDDGCN